MDPGVSEEPQSEVAAGKHGRAATVWPDVSSLTRVFATAFPHTQKVTQPAATSDDGRETTKDAEADRIRGAAHENKS